ncbi:hypothetical protein M378DRAFT_359317 [Amanita muscaria Koide BX008]|uniref:Uncharacterized protein n=1 Tax=Amanita muscaria (strain Koide BX008) TaxID=946122 RepID=A0A0C2SUV9_AMAMK|nr:hypothetical protein M378DRAFT_359317 [Amanita muscaria Koide BX008]
MTEVNEPCIPKGSIMVTPVPRPSSAFNLGRMTGGLNFYRCSKLTYRTHLYPKKTSRLQRG